ncbi:hypothetical protein IscW_ISCW000410, partial [Ixodes scapularis]
MLFEDRTLIKCNFFKKANFTVTLAPGYQGIPENLLINLVMWVSLITLYSVLNRTAKNYSRMALLHNRDDQKDRHVLKKNGPDAVQYLTFQRHIIVFVLIVCLCCVGIILPIHVFGDIEGDARKFVHTTLNNMDPKAASLWVHVVFAFLFLPLGVMFMRHFSAKLHIHPEE